VSTTVVCDDGTHRSSKIDQNRATRATVPKSENATAMIATRRVNQVQEAGRPAEAGLPETDRVRRW
jgi:hypothetical protein